MFSFHLSKSNHFYFIHIVSFELELTSYVNSLLIEEFSEIEPRITAILHRVGAGDPRTRIYGAAIIFAGIEPSRNCSAQLCSYCNGLLCNTLC
jgi:hypothetical protein